MVNKVYNGKETRYYGDVIVSLGNRLYFTCLNVLFGKYNNLNIDTIIYNQTETDLSEYDLTLQIYTKKVIVKIGYSFMEMEDRYNNQNQEITSKVFNFN